MARSKAQRNRDRKDRQFLQQLANPENMLMVNKLISGHPLDETETARQSAMPKLTRKLIRFVESGAYQLCVEGDRSNRLIASTSKKAPKPSISREDFYTSQEWRRLRYRALVQHGGKCQGCGRGREHSIVIHVDHVKPISRFPHIKLEITNLQVLCEDCNLGKGAWDQTDWRSVPDLKLVVND